MDGVLVNVVLPLVLAVMMFTMGMSLTVADFKRVAVAPKAFFTGAVNQVLLLPLITFAVATAFGLAPEMAAGFMVLAACPGGITSNMLTHYAKGDLALSISLTAVISLLGFLTIPAVVSFGLSHFLADTSAVTPPAERIAGTVFVLTLLPVGLGMAFRRFAESAADKATPVMNGLSAVLFAVVVIGAVASNWTLFVDNVATIGTAAIALNILMMGLGFGSARLLSLEPRQATSISLETGVQNAAMGIVIANTVLQNEVFGLPSAIYGVLMYGPAFALVALLRRRNGAGQSSVEMAA